LITERGEFGLQWAWATTARMREVKTFIVMRIVCVRPGLQSRSAAISDASNPYKSTLIIRESNTTTKD